MKRILITGASGFIGQATVAVLRDEKDTNVTAVTRKKNAPGSEKRESLENEEWIYSASLMEIPKDCLEAIDIIIHLASAGVSPKKAEWDECIETNYTTTISFFRYAVRCGVKRIVLSGSSHEYGSSADDFPFIPPDAPLKPLNVYGATKAAASTAAFTLARELEVEFLIARFFNIYGEGQYSGNLWPSLRDAAIKGADFQMTSGAQVRDFLEVSQAARNLIDLAKSDLKRGVVEQINIGSGIGQTLKSFVEHWWSEFNATGELRFGAIPYRKDDLMRVVPLLTR